MLFIQCFEQYVIGFHVLEYSLIDKFTHLKFIFLRYTIREKIPLAKVAHANATIHARLIAYLSFLSFMGHNDGNILANSFVTYTISTTSNTCGTQGSFLDATLEKRDNRHGFYMLVLNVDYNRFVNLRI